MATLSLTLLSHPEYGSSRPRHIHDGELTVGRGPECDWALPDPMKSLSRKHCRLTCSAEVWRVQDLSTNGTYVNSAAEPLGRGLVQVLNDGDRLRLGDYEIEVRIVQQDVHEQRLPATPLGVPVVPGFGAARLPGLDDQTGFDMPAVSGPPQNVPGAFPDHGASSSDAFALPPVASPGMPLVPDDWLNDAGAEAGPPPGSAVPIPSEVGPFEPVHEVMDAPHREAPNPHGVPSTPTVERGLPSARSAQAVGSDSNGAIAVLMDGSGLPPETAIRAASDPVRLLQTAGALLLASVSGLRRLLIARGMVKREFRIEQTMLLAKENNPLKFAASDHQALAALLDLRTQSVQAMQESIDDLTTHQVAMMAATQSAARALLQKLDPGVLEAEDTGGRSLLDSREKRLWEAYKRRHAKLLEQFEDDFESAFGTAFARAYEQAVDKDKG